MNLSIYPNILKEQSSKRKTEEKRESSSDKSINGDKEKEKIEEREQNILLRGHKAHLFYLMPELSECICSKEPELKEHLKKLFVLLYTEIGVKQNK